LRQAGLGSSAPLASGVGELEAVVRTGQERVTVIDERGQTSLVAAFTAASEGVLHRRRRSRPSTGSSSQQSSMGFWYGYERRWPSWLPNWQRLSLLVRTCPIGQRPIGLFT
jgi:hypothetical protein